MSNAFTIEVNGKILQAVPVGNESLMDALERVVAAYAEEPIRQTKCEPRGQNGQRSVAVTFESGVTWGAHILPANSLYEDGHYWTHSTYGPSVRAAWRKVEIKDGAVRVIEPERSPHLFDQPFFFDVNTMVGKVT